MYWARQSLVQKPARPVNDKGDGCLNLPQRPPEAGRQPVLPPNFIVLHDNWNTWCVFEYCSDQWNFVFLPLPGGGVVPHYQSFNLQSVESAIRCLGIPRKRKRRVFREIRYLIDGAKAVLNGRQNDTNDTGNSG